MQMSEKGIASLAEFIEELGLKSQLQQYWRKQEHPEDEILIEISKFLGNDPFMLMITAIFSTEVQKALQMIKLYAEKQYPNYVQK